MEAQQKLPDDATWAREELVERVEGKQCVPALFGLQTTGYLASRCVSMLFH